MATLLIESVQQKKKAREIQEAVERGELPAVTRAPGAGSERPADYVPVRLPGVHYAGQWWPEGNPVGKQLEAMRYMLPAPSAGALYQRRLASCHDQMMNLYVSWLLDEIAFIEGRHCPQEWMDAIQRDFNQAAKGYLRCLHEKTRVRRAPKWNAFDDISIRECMTLRSGGYDIEDEYHEAQPQPAPVLPQALQDPRDVADLIAATASRLSIKQKREAATPPTTKSQYPEAFQRVIDGKVVNCL